MSISGLGTLYAILKRDIDRKNSLLSKRMELADELRENATDWVKYLMASFNDAIELYESKGKEAALERVNEQIIDFLNLDYHSLKNDSDIVDYLQEDQRFLEFSEACVQFYDSALNIKRLVFGGIENNEGNYVSMQDESIKEIVSLYHAEVKAMHNNILKEHNKLKLIEPK